MILEPPQRGQSLLSANLAELKRRKIPHSVERNDDGTTLVRIPLSRLTMRYSIQGELECSYGGTTI